MEPGGTREIQLNRGFVVLVDAADFDWLNQWKWHVSGGAKPYVIRRQGPNGKPVTIWMHREIVAPGPGLFVDHVNGDRLDNRRTNLRPCTRAENNRNTPRNTGRFPYKGVSVLSGYYRASVRADGKVHYFGTRHPTVEAAARAYDEGAILLHGEFARLNFPAEANGLGFLTSVLRRG